ncbi:MAG: hypothetical protein HY714_04755 [Candidatus Omnitrophica bacterium]|nr:hypothetical protein [Candidatus Omnitrophota bacterium]
MKSPFQGSIKNNISAVTSLVLYAALFIAAARSPDLLPRKISVPVIRSLLAGEDRSILPVGYEFEPYRRFLPARGRLGFIMDFPFHPYGKTITQLYSAQTYFVPVVLNPNPGDPVALLYCSNRFIADQRLAETGYRLAAVLADGKGFAVKKT